MAMQVPAFLQTIRDQMMADKKKTAIMSVLLVILLGSVSRFFVGQQNEELVAATPAVATAAPTMAPVVESIARTPPAVASPVPQAVQVDRSEPKVVVRQMPRSLDRDLFNSPALSTFSSAHGLTGDTEEPRESTFWDAVITKMADRQKSLVKERKSLDEEIATLRLQSTLTGPAPLAYISGRMLREGDEFRGFSVVRIEDRRVMLRKSVFTRPLTMP
jgi:hypothetical protein